MDWHQFSQQPAAWSDRLQLHKWRWFRT